MFDNSSALRFSFILFLSLVHSPESTGKELLADSEKNQIQVFKSGSWSELNSDGVDFEREVVNDPNKNRALDVSLIKPDHKKHEVINGLSLEIARTHISRESYQKNNSITVTPTAKGDVNSLNLEEGTVIPFKWSTETLPHTEIDSIYSIRIKGARYIKARLKSSLVDKNDLAAFYDVNMNFNPIPNDFIANNPDQEVWLKPVQGDTISFRFANAGIIINHVVEKFSGLSLNELESKVTRNRFLVCNFGRSSCALYEPSSLVGSSRSEGFVISGLKAYF